MPLPSVGTPRNHIQDIGHGQASGNQLKRPEKNANRGRPEIPSDSDSGRLLRRQMLAPIGSSMNRIAMTSRKEPLPGMPQFDNGGSPGTSTNFRPNSNEEEFYRQYRAEQTSLPGFRNQHQRLSRSDAFKVEPSTIDGPFGRTGRTQPSVKEMQSVIQKRAGITEKVSLPLDTETSSSKSRKGKRPEKKNGKNGKCKKLGHKYEDLPTLRQVRLKNTMDMETVFPKEARYIPTPPGEEKIPLYAVKPKKLADRSYGNKSKVLYK